MKSKIGVTWHALGGVALFMGAWIEIFSFPCNLTKAIVALFMGAWIEIMEKFRSTRLIRVALFMGAWIEIIKINILNKINEVALFMGAWIEIFFALEKGINTLTSHSSWVRGLKF